jgi:hypothetical protein
VTTVDCCREEDVLDALTSGRWPQRASAELRAHVASCAICADVVAVAGAVLEARDHEPAEMRIPSSAVMWWRAQMRARQEAAREAARPITIAQVVASVSALALMVAALIALSPWFGGLLGSVAAEAKDVAAALRAPAGVLAQGSVVPVIAAGVAVWLVLAPVAIYFAVADE